MDASPDVIDSNTDPHGAAADVADVADDAPGDDSATIIKAFDEIFTELTEKGRKTDDVASPNDASPPPPSVGASVDELADARPPEEAATATPDDDPPPSSEKVAATTTVPEPPRWRFINVAKKSLGYSSEHAGSYIRGQSNHELGAKYTAPDVSLYKPAKEAAEVQKMECELPSHEPFAKDDVEVGRLSGGVPPPSAFSIQGNEVGKLDIREAESSEMQSPSGTFAGLPKAVAPAAASRKPFREWETNIELGPRKEREHEWHDGEVQDRYKMPGDDVHGKTRGGVGRIQFHGPGESEEDFVGSIARGNRGGESDGRENADDNDEYGDPREGALFVQNSGSEDTIEKSSHTELTEPIDDEDQTKKRRCFYLLLLIPLLIGVVVGAVLATRDEEEKAVAAAAVGGLLIPPIIILANETDAPSSSLYPSASPSVEHSLQPSIQASSQPSLPPSMECPLGTAPFAIDHPQHFTTRINGATWKVKDACSGEVMAQCFPCSEENALPRPWGALAVARDNGPAPPQEDTLRENIKCLPVDNEYVLEVLPAEDSEECCGFDPTSAIMSYDNIMIADMASEGIFGDGSSTYFGVRETPCPSEAPSASPSASPSAKPTCSTDQAFNLCVAVDMSGSVCNDGAGSECLGCRAAFLPMFFDSECKDPSVGEDTCCENFGKVKAFSTLMVNLLDDFPAEKSFSVVQFSTDAQMVSGLSSAARTMPIFDGLDYTGGLTNHAAAIQTCQDTLPSWGDRKNFIMLITDGVSSEPGLDPEAVARAAATAAKAKGTFVIPVFISPYNDWNALAFMRDLSNDGKVFDVTDFDSLDGLQDRLVDQVSCS